MLAGTPWSGITARHGPATGWPNRRMITRRTGASGRWRDGFARATRRSRRARARRERERSRIDFCGVLVIATSCGAGVTSCGVQQGAQTTTRRSESFGTVSLNAWVMRWGIRVARPMWRALSDCGAHRREVGRHRLQTIARPNDATAARGSVTDLPLDQIRCVTGCGPAESCRDDDGCTPARWTLTALPPLLRLASSFRASCGCFVRAEEGTRTPDLPLTRRQALWVRRCVVRGVSGQAPPSHRVSPRVRVNPNDAGDHLGFVIASDMGIESRRKLRPRARVDD